MLTVCAARWAIVRTRLRVSQIRVRSRQTEQRARKFRRGGHLVFAMMQR